jgi:NDP-sugar pyrophosphorylase family protein
METLEIKNDLLKDLLEDNTEIKVSTKKLLDEVFINKDQVLVIILLYKNENFKQITKPYNLEIFDKKMVDWIIDSCREYEIKTVSCDKNSNIVTLIKPLLNEKPYTLVLYSDTPLLTKETIVENIDYFALSGMNVLKLPRGWIFKTEYIKEADSISGVQSRQYNDFEFKPVLNLKDFSIVTDIIKQKIFEKHYQNEVIIIDEKSTYIGAEVIIDPGTRIEPNNVIKGLTYIGRNCVLEPFNYIQDSIISNNCIIKNSNVIKSKITENMVVGPFEIIENKQS